MSATPLPSPSTGGGMPYGRYADPGGGAAASIGRVTRRVRGRMARLPGLTATADLLAARHCVDLLAAGVKEYPGDPLRYVWLAEALQRVQRDMRMLLRLRWAAAVATGAGAVALVARTVIRKLAGLGETGGEEPAVRLLRRAYALGSQRLARGADPATLHTLARVYLGQGMPAETLRLTRLAASMSPAPAAEVLVTAARAYLALRRPEDAARLAERAIEQGSSVGYDVLAQARIADRSRLARRPVDGVGDWRELRRRVRLEDRVRYYGAARTQPQTALVLSSAQWAKTRATVSEAVALSGRARKGMTA